MLIFHGEIGSYSSTNVVNVLKHETVLQRRISKIEVAEENNHSKNINKNMIQKLLEIEI
jgi:hypothetical protein